MSRIETLSVLPLFHKLQGKKVLLAGNGYGMDWKRELMQATGATLIETPNWEAHDFSNLHLAILGTDDEGEAERFYNKAKEQGAIAYVIDKPKFCDVTFGTIVNRSPIVIGISTTGAAPILGQALRAKIETILPQNLKQWGALALQFRAQLKAKNAPSKPFWYAFVERLFKNEVLPAFDEVLIEKPQNGKVLLVGAGTGDPELLTIKALNALQRADIIFYDALVSHQVLELARREAERIYVGKRGYGQACKQSEINALILEQAQAGKTVVRLKAGCATIFARSGEEVEACQAAGIEVEIIAGITAAQAAAACLKISLTHRDYAKQIQYITGHGKNGLLPEELNLEGMIKGETTTAIYMPQKTLAAFVQKLLVKGADPFMPATAIADISLPFEQTLHGNLRNLPALLEQAKINAPVLVLLGKALLQHPYHSKQQTDFNVTQFTSIEA